jgi:hypothetical protein
VPEWASRKQVEDALTKARREYKKAHDKMLEAGRKKKDQKTIDKLKEASDAKLKVCKDLQYVLDRMF